MSPTTAMAVTIESAAAEALDDAEGDQLGQILRQPAQGRADEEDDDCGLQHHAAAVDIAELAVERNHDGGGE